MMVETSVLCGERWGDVSPYKHTLTSRPFHPHHALQVGFALTVIQCTLGAMYGILQKVRAQMGLRSWHTSIGTRMWCCISLSPSLLSP